MMNKIEKKITILVVLLLATHNLLCAGEVDVAAENPFVYEGTPMQYTAGKGVGALISIGGVGLIGHQGWNLYQVVQKIIKERAAKGQVVDMTDFDTAQEILKLAFKSSRVSKPALALGGVLCASGLVGLGASSSGASSDKERKRKAHNDKVAKYKGIIESDIIHKDDKAKFVDLALYQTHLDTLDRIFKELEKTSNRKKINEEDIDFLKEKDETDVAFAQATYDQLKERIEEHNKKAKTEIKEELAKGWNAFKDDCLKNSYRAVAQEIGFNEEFFKYNGASLTWENVQGWYLNHSSLLTLIRKDFERIADANLGHHLIKIPKNPGNLGGDEGIFEAFVGKVKENNYCWLEKQVNEKKERDFFVYQDAISFEDFIDNALKKGLPPLEEGDNRHDSSDYFERADGQEHSIFALHQQYKEFLIQQRHKKAQELFKNHELAQDIDFKAALKFDEKTDEEYKVIDQLKWMLCSAKKLNKRVSHDLDLRARQKYDLLVKVATDLTSNGVDACQINKILPIVAQWYDKERKLEHENGYDLFMQVFNVFETLGFMHEKNADQTKVNCIKAILPCFSKEYQGYISQAFDVLTYEYEDDWHDGTKVKETQAYRIYNVPNRNTALQGVQLIKAHELEKVDGMGAAMSKLVSVIVGDHAWAWKGRDGESPKAIKMPMKGSAK